MTSRVTVRQGGDLRGLAPSGEYLDVGTCVNRYGPPAAVESALAGLDVRELLAHPFEAEERFLAAYADYMAVEPGELVVGRGITELIRILGRILPKEAVATITPDYTDTIRTFPVHRPADGGALDTVDARLERLLDAMAVFDYVILSNPNNPLGLHIAPEMLVDACRAYPGSVLVVDEAFVDFVAGASPASVVGADVENLAVLRSPNKLFGIAGARVGALWTRNESLRVRVASDTLNWSISHLDAAVAVAALAAREWAISTRARVLANAVALERLLVERFDTVVSGVPVHYRFVSTPAPEAVYEQLLARGVVARAFSGLEPGRVSGIRITAPTDAEFDILAAALA